MRKCGGRWPYSPDGRSNIVVLVRFRKVIVRINDVNDLISILVQRAWQVEYVLGAPFPVTQGLRYGGSGGVKLLGQHRVAIVLECG